MANSGSSRLDKRPSTGCTAPERRLAGSSPGMSSYALIVNPSSGRGKALRKAEALRVALGGAGVEILETTSRGSAVTLAAEGARRAAHVVAVGGDGTLHEVLNGLIGCGIPSRELPSLGFLSAGTANVAQSAFGLTSDPAALARAFATVQARPVDVGLVRYGGEERAFLLWLGAGWDAVVIRTLNAGRTGHMGVRGLFGNVPSIVRDIARYEQPMISARVDEVPVGEHGTVIVANVGPVAFGGAVTHHADPSDGLLDVVGAPHTTPMRFLRLASRMMLSSLSSAPDVLHAPARSVTLSSDGDVPFHLDGEPVGSLPVEITVLPHAVRLLGAS